MKLISWFKGHVEVFRKSFLIVRLYKFYFFQFVNIIDIYICIDLYRVVISAVLGIFATKKFAVGKLAARNFRRSRPEQTPFMGIWLTISTWYKLRLAPLTEQTRLANIDYLVTV